MGKKPIDRELTEEEAARHAEESLERRAVQNRDRRERVAAARAQITNATSQLEAARDNMSATGISNPVFLELRDTIVVGHRMIARATELLRRIP